jgi:signal transduction histidine kinase
VASYTNAHTRLTNAAASHARAMDRYREVALEARPGAPRRTNAALECVVTFDRYNRQHARYTAVFAQYRDAFTRLAEQAYGPDGRPRPQQSNAPARVEVERRFLVATNEFTLAFSTYTNALVRYAAQEELRPFAAALRGRPRVEAERLEASPRSAYGVTEREHGAQYLLLRIALMLLLGACCYGLEALIDKQRLAFEEAREFEARQHQLKAAGRMAAQIAHQVKNPLAIINNAAWCLEQPASDANLPADQARIIREEVRKADQIITRLMGYAQLAEGRVEKLVVAEELQRAFAEVFPPGAGYPIQVETGVAPDLPPLLMQRAHLSEILVNLLLNAREALNGPGRVRVTAALGPDETVELRVSDTGPGVPPERREKIFEPYFSTKEKGSGLGLAIVRNSAGMYGGTVRVESELGKGATFIVSLPIRTLMKSSP